MNGRDYHLAALVSLGLGAGVVLVVALASTLIHHAVAVLGAL